MNKLEQLLKETNYTKEEWETYRKVENNCNLLDLCDLLDELLEKEDITQEQYDLACENANIIIEEYKKLLNYDWRNTGNFYLCEAIDYILYKK